MNLSQSLYAIALAAGTAIIASFTVVSLEAPEAPALPASEFDEFKAPPRKVSRFGDGIQRVRVTGRTLEPLVDFYRTAFPEIKAAKTGKRPQPKGEWTLTVTVSPKQRRLNDPALILLVKTMAECRVDPPQNDSNTFIFENVSRAYADRVASEFLVLGETARVEKAVGSTK